MAINIKFDLNKTYFEIEINDLPENTKTIKGFICK